MPLSFKPLLFTIKKILMRTTPKKSIILLIESKNSVKLQVTEIDHKLLFDKNIASLRKKSTNQLHAICRL